MKILTVTANSTVDQTVLVPAFHKESTMRARVAVQSMGGKPSDASFILGTLGIPSKAIGFAAGMYGQKFRALLTGRGVTVDFIEVDGETRLNMLIVDESDSTLSTITVPTLRVRPDHTAALLAQCDRELEGAQVLVTGGTLPSGMEPTFYTELIAMAHTHQVPVVFDASGPFLSAGLQARPAYFKPNRDELSTLLGRPIRTIPEAYQAGREVLDRYRSAPIITLGADGALAVLPDRAWYIPPIQVKVVSPAGAGDCVLAGIAASIATGEPIEEGLRMGVAAATATLLQAATADLTVEDYQRFRAQVRLTPYPPG